MIGLMERKGIVGQVAVTITAVENKEKTVQVDLCDIVNCGGNKRAWRGYNVYGLCMAFDRSHSQGTLVSHVA